MSTIRFFYAHVALHWGFIVRVPGATAAQPALALPPPTTVVGAFAASLLKALGLREGDIVRSGKASVEGAFSQIFQCILGSTVAASMGLHPKSEGSGIAVIMEPSRLVAVPYKTGGDAEESFKRSPWTTKFYTDSIVKALPVQAVGVAYGPSTLLDLVWVVDVEKLVDCLPGRRVKVEDVDDVSLKASYGVTRLGSKEGICSTLAACYTDSPAIIKVGELFRAHTYVPAECVHVWTGELVSKVQLWDLNYKFVEYYAPLNTTVTLAYPPAESDNILPVYRLRENCVAYHLNVDRLPKECGELRNVRGVERAVAVGPRGERGV